MSKVERKAELEYSFSLRITHWVRFFCIAALTVTGFYLAYVFVAPGQSGEPILFLNAKMRMWHLVFGFVLIGVTIFKFYIFLFDKKRVARLEIISFLDFMSPKVWIAQIKYYLFLGEHPKVRGVYNPIQFMAYLALYVLLAVLILSGLVLYVHVYHDGLGGFLYEFMRFFEKLMGGLANVRQVHHVAMWGVLIFIPAHIYMIIFNSIKSKEGAIDSIFSGYRFNKTEH